MLHILLHTMMNADPVFSSVDTHAQIFECLLQPLLKRG
jgi:hypothetical protein